jgi:hypothetical protein
VGTARIAGRLAWVFLAVAAVCRLAYELIGARVDESGVLHEPFFLIPLGLLAAVVGGGSLVVWAVAKGVAWRRAAH